MPALVKNEDSEFSKQKIQALDNFWPVLANPTFVHKTQDEMNIEKRRMK